MADIFLLMERDLKISIRFFLLLLLMLSASSSYSRTSSSKCINQIISLDESHLSCLKNHAVSQSIKHDFHRLLDRRMSCKNCAEAFSGEMNFAPLFDSHFLVMKIEKNDFGGAWVKVIFKESPSHIYRLWLYPIEKNTFQLRDFSSMKADAEMQIKMQKLKEKKYERYWIPPVKKYPIDALLKVVRPAK